MMCARGVSQDLFPVRTRFGRNCQIPHFGAAHLGTLQGVTARWIIAVPPIIGSKHGRGATPAGPLGGFQRAFQAVRWAVRGAMPRETGLPDRWIDP